jgi:hypothetical protein
MSVEAALSLWAAWTARSPALAGFGGDSAIELMSAAIVLWRFRKLASEHAEQRASRIAGGRCRICFVRLPLNHRSYGSRGSCNLAHCMGRPDCSIGNYSADRGRGSEGHARQGLWLL